MTRVSMLSTSPTPITGGAALAALPALAQFDFPVAMIASELTVDGRVRTLVEAGQIDEVFPFASVTKPIVAWSALVAVERGLLDLDAPAGAGTAHSAAGAMLPGATVRHLLAHASGIAFDSDAVLAAPGTRRIYSNRGIEILGERLQEATATPAHSGEGTARDLAVFAGELAAPRLISASLAAEATSVVFPGLDGVLPGYGRQAPNDFGLGVEVRGHKHPHWTGRAGSPATFGHFGQSGSFIWVDPEARRQAVFLGERRFAAVHKDIWPDLCDQILALEAPDSAVNG